MSEENTNLSRRVLVIIEYGDKGRHLSLQEIPIDSEKDDAVQNAVTEYMMSEGSNRTRFGVLSVHDIERDADCLEVDGKLYIIGKSSVSMVAFESVVSDDAGVNTITHLRGAHSFTLAKIAQKYKSLYTEMAVTCKEQEAQIARIIKAHPGAAHV